MPARTVIPALLILLVAMALLSLGFGSVGLPFSDLAAGLLAPGENLAAEILWEYRLPRMLFAFLIGAMLAMAGALMQTLLRNPLAEPYILGTSGGAAAGVLGAFLLSLPAWLHLPVAFAGAVVSTILLFLFSGFLKSRDPNRLLLTGIVLTTGWGALITFLLTLSPTSRIPGMLFWLVGDLNEQASLLVPGLTLLLAAALLLVLARPLDLMLLGERQAASVGVDVANLRLLLLAVAVILTAVAVTYAGPIGFVGLVTPHIVRLMAGSGHRLLLPASALLGGSLLIGADLLSRTLIAPRMMPVGVFTALLGVPLFLYLIRRQS
ncbi:MAG: iron ABC transporter permease [Gammaproteobacteria bacterium]